MQRLFTSESVSKGHPDKICDQISDDILDNYINGWKNVFSGLNPPKVACEVFGTGNKIIIGGEVNAGFNILHIKVAKETLLKIGLDPCQFKIFDYVNQQSNDIALGVDKGGAGDQGMMFGYATNESKNYMPLAINLANDLIREATDFLTFGVFKWAKPDMKSQVTIDYTDPTKPRIHTILMSIQHDENYNDKSFRKFIREEIIAEVVGWYGLNTDYKVLINPTGRFVIGGLDADTGLTGRKIIADTYGGYAHHGGGAFSGKDPTKVDRTAAYMARYVAKNLVAAGVADKIEIQLSYAIGKPKPISVFIDAFETNKVPMDLIYRAVELFFNFDVNEMIKTLDLWNPIYSQTSTLGHFGKENLPWEKLDKQLEIRDFVFGKIQQAYRK